MSWGKFALVELGMHLESFVGGSNPPKGKKKLMYVHFISVHSLYKILFDDNIVKYDYNMFNFKIYLKNYDIL